MNPLDAAGSAAGALLSRLRSGAAVLGPSERRVVRTIIDRADEVIEWSTAELAIAADTSAATVVRACQSLGFRGYQHLRLELARLAEPVQAEPVHAAEAIFGEAADAIRASREGVDVAAFDRGVETLIRARRVLMVGTGFSSPPIQDAALRLLTAGRPVEAPIDVQAQQFAARLLDEQDACLAVSYSGANANTLRACAAAKRGGATLIVVTSFERSPLTRLADVALVTGAANRAHDVDPYLSRISHGLVLHALHRGILAHPGRGSLLDRMRDVVADALADDVQPG